jgi:hypothetical protein
MVENRKVKSGRKVIPLDGDKLGMIGGTFGALIVLIMSLYFHKGDIVTTLLRVGWAFVICYGAIFIFVRIILRTTLQEMIEQKKRDAIAVEELVEEPEEAPDETE